MELSFVKHSVLQRRVIKIKQTSLRPIKSNKQALHVLRNECNEIIIMFD